jgi:hypothetical protein
LRLRRTIALFAGLVAVGSAAAPGHAGDGGPVIVVPGKAGVPVIINGRDVSWAVIYGDWGLMRPGAGDLIIEGGGMIDPRGYPGGYYPSTGRQPVYGRREIEPLVGRRPLRPAPTYYRSWSAEPAPGPVTEYPPVETPPVVLMPRQSSQPRR